MVLCWFRGEREDRTWEGCGKPRRLASCSPRLGRRAVERGRVELSPQVRCRDEPVLPVRCDKAKARSAQLLLAREPERTCPPGQPGTLSLPPHEPSEPRSPFSDWSPVLLDRAPPQRRPTLLSHARLQVQQDVSPLVRAWKSIRSVVCCERARAFGGSGVVRSRRDGWLEGAGLAGGAGREADVSGGVGPALASGARWIGLSRARIERTLR